MSPILVLVVEDDNGARQAMADFLTEEGYEIVVAEDGQRALELIEERIPALLITDLEMPRINGEGLIEYVQHKHMGMPILVITSRLVVDAQREARRLSVAGFLNKPIDLDVLTTAVKSALARA